MINTFRSTHYGAPANTNAAGSALAILEACLVTGYGSQTATLTRAGSTVTVTVPVNHTLDDGVYMTISGANETEYNGSFKITVTGAKTFTYICAGEPTTPATGTITSKVSPVGWTKPFTGTNAAAFMQGNPGSAYPFSRYLWVSDNATGQLITRGYETMTGADAGTNPFPSVSQYSTGIPIHKSDSAIVQPWVLVGSERWFYFIPRTNSSTYYLNPYFFGDLSNSGVPGDLYHTYISGNSSPTANEFCNQASTSLRCVARNYNQIGLSTPVYAVLSRYDYSTGAMGLQGLPYPAPIDGALHLARVNIWHPGVGERGVMPNLYVPLHNRPFQHNDLVVDPIGIPGVTLLCQNSYNGQILLEI